MAFELNKFMALMIAEALVPVFFVIFLGYPAGARRIIDNQHLASLIVLLMTFAVPVAAFVGVAQTSRRGLQEDGNAYPQFSGKRHYVNGSNFSDFANEMRAHDLLQISGLADLVYVGWELLPLDIAMRLEQAALHDPYFIEALSKCLAYEQLG